MGLLDIFRRDTPSSAPQPARFERPGEGVLAYSLNDPFIADFLRGGLESVTGKPINVSAALRNPAMFRAVSLISNSIGMLPTHVLDQDTGEKAKDHPLFRLLHRRPNDWQTAFDFKSTMQLRALAKGDAYALIVRSPDVRTGKKYPVRLVPLDSDKVDPVLGPDWTVTYRYDSSQHGRRVLRSDEVLHLRGLSLDGLHGICMLRQARDAIAIALAAEMAAGRLFKNGLLANAAVKHPGRLSPEAYDRLVASMAEKEGPENAGKTMIFEEGLDWAALEATAKDAQLAELRKIQVEEIARVSGVPRPLLMLDETSWGTGIYALGQFFVTYALNPWFEAWQQAAERSLLNEDEQDRFSVKFNPAAILRGSMKEQADFLSKALGAGGHAPWMHVDEVRDAMDLPKRDNPPHAMLGQSGKPAPDDEDDDVKPTK